MLTERVAVCTGQSDSTNGKNNVYDEMIDDLCEPDGSDRLEYCALHRLARRRCGSVPTHVSALAPQGNRFS